MESTARRSGRTTRMVEEAIETAMAGHHVWIIVHNAVMVDYVRGIIRNIGERLCVPTAERRDAMLFGCGVISIETGDIFYTPRFQDGRSISYVFLDHAVLEVSAQAVYTGLDFGARDWHSSHVTFIPSDAKLSRDARFDALRAEGKKLGEINTILEAEGYSEVFGEGVMPCPTKHHAIVRENKGARKLIASLPGGA